MRAPAASSVSAPSIASRTAGRFAAPRGDVSTPSAPALAAAPPANTNGSSRYASCQTGMAVSATSTPVYVATAGARPAAATLATRAALRRPTRSPSAATPTAGPYTVSSHDPTFIGDVTLATRSMW